MPPAPRGPRLQRVRWRQAWRIVSTRHPPIQLFERVSDDPAVWETLIELEQDTNPRIRQEVGVISLVPPARRISGPGAGYVMASFTHLNPKGSRFSDGSFGVYYCADALETAIAETVYHFERFAADSGDPIRHEPMRVLLGVVDHQFHDVSTISKARQATILDRSSYTHSQPFAVELRDAGSDGVLYPSVRHAGGSCVAAFWPDVVRPPIQERVLTYHWNGTRVDRYFDPSLDRWVQI